MIGSMIFGVLINDGRKSSIIYKEFIDANGEITSLMSFNDDEIQELIEVSEKLKWKTKL